MLRLILLLVAGLASPSVAATRPPITAIAFAPKGQSLVAVSQSGLHIFAWPELKLTRTIKLSIPNLHAVAFSPDEKLLAVGGGSPAEEGLVSLVSWPEGELVATLDGHHDDSVRSVAWVGPSRLISASIDRTIILWDLKTREAISTLTGHSRRVNAVCLLPESQMFISTGVDRSVRVWDLKSRTLVRSLNQHTGDVQTLSLRPSPGGLPMIASGASDRTIRFWQPTIGRMVRYIRLQSEPLSMAWLPDGRRLAAACSDGHLRLVDADELKLLGDLPAIDGWAYAIQVHPSDGSIAVAGSNGQIRRIERQALPESQSSNPST